MNGRVYGKSLLPASPLALSVKASIARVPTPIASATLDLDVSFRVASRTRASWSWYGYRGRRVLPHVNHPIAVEEVHREHRVALRQWRQNHDVLHLRVHVLGQIVPIEVIVAG